MDLMRKVKSRKEKTTKDNNNSRDDDDSSDEEDSDSPDVDDEEQLSYERDETGKLTVCRKRLGHRGSGPWDGDGTRRRLVPCKLIIMHRKNKTCFNIQRM